jgi:hypothetical protein
MTNITLSILTATQQEKDDALINAAHIGNVPGAAMLLEAGANVKAQWPSDHGSRHFTTPLGIAASGFDATHRLNGRAMVLDLLLSHGAEVFTQDEKDHALFIALGAGIEAVKVLLKHGANPNAQRSNGQAPLHAVVASNGDPALMALLIDHGADMNERDADLNTPIRLAVGIGRTSAVRLLLDRGADTDVMMDPSQPLAMLAQPGEEIWTMLVLNPRTGTFRERFERVVKAADPAALKELLTQRGPDDDLSGGIAEALLSAYMWTSNNRQGAKVKSPSKWWTDAGRCVRALVKAGAPDRTIVHHHGNGRDMTIPEWLHLVRREILTGTTGFERVAATLHKLFMDEEHKALRSVIAEVEASVPSRAERSRL